MNGTAGITQDYTTSMADTPSGAWVLTTREMPGNKILMPNPLAMVTTTQGPLCYVCVSMSVFVYVCV